MPTTRELRDRLADVDRRVEPIAASHPEGSDVSVLASAIHNLVMVLGDLVAND